MPTGKFIAALSDGHASHHHNLRPISVTISRVAKGAVGVGLEVSFSELTEPVPTSPTSFLQVWHLGALDQDELRLDSYMRSMRKGDPARNVLVTEIAGVVREVSPEQFEFLALGPAKTGPALAPAHVGWLTLDLFDARQDRGWPDGKLHRVKISHDGADDLITLACVLSPSPTSKLEAPLRAPRFRCFNVQHALGTMLAETSPGLTVGLHVQILDKQTHQPVPANTNDGSFFRYGEWMARMFHSIGVTPDGELTLNTSPFSSLQDLLDRLVQIRAAVKRATGRDAPIKRLFLITHGDSNPKYFSASGGGVLLCDDKTWMSSTNGLDAFASLLKTIATDDVVVALCACLAGTSPTGWPNDFTHFADLGIAERGAGSIADKLRIALGTGPDARANAAVWAHTSTGDALRNMQLRAFTRHGNADVSWFRRGKPKDADAALALATAWNNAFPQHHADTDPRFWEFLNLMIQNPTDNVKEVLGG